MAFVHCHKCDWEQDDFWTWRYNPIRCILQDIRYYWRPRRIGFDREFAREHGSKDNRLHSWYLLIWSLKRNYRKYKKMHWHTYEDFKKDPMRFWCPNCKCRGLCID